MSDRKTFSVSQEHIDKLINEAETQEAIFWDKELVISFKLHNGFTVLGRAACVDPANFDLVIGRKIAKDNAKEQLWQLEGYLLQTKLHYQKSTPSFPTATPEHLKG